MKLALYRSGKSPIGGSISWFTRSVYSHVALWFPQHEEVYEAIASGWVVAPTLASNHGKNIRIDVLEYVDPLTPEQEDKAWQLCRKMLGAPYDYAAVFGGFPLRWNLEQKKGRKKFFCSEGAILVAAAIGRPIIAPRVPAWKCSPEDVFKSAVLKWDESYSL